MLENFNEDKSIVKNSTTQLQALLCLKILTKIKEKILRLNSPIFILDGVYFLVSKIIFQ